MAETGWSDWLFWRWVTACWRALCKRHHKHKGIKCHNARLTDTSPLLYSRLFFFFLFLESRVSGAARFFPEVSASAADRPLLRRAQMTAERHTCAALAGHRSWEAALASRLRGCLCKLGWMKHLNLTLMKRNSYFLPTFYVQTYLNHVCQLSDAVARVYYPPKKRTHQTVYDDENHRIVTLSKCQEDLRVNC